MDLTKLRKLESPGPAAAAKGVGQMITALVKVKSPSYRPPGVNVRADISDLIFTAEFPEQTLAALEKDPGIATISVSRNLQSQKGQD